MEKKYAQFFISKLKEAVAENMCTIAQEVLSEAENTRQISVVHKNVLHLKPDTFLSTPPEYFLKIAKRYGTKAYVMKALNLLDIWNRKQNPAISKHAQEIKEWLENNPEWQKLKTKKEPEELADSMLESNATKKIKVEHPGVLNLKKSFMKTGPKFFIQRAKKIGKKEVMLALLNLERWNKNTNPVISKHARQIINTLKKSKEWQNLT